MVEMIEKIIKKDKLNVWLNELIKEYEIIGPIIKNDIVLFDVVKDITQIQLEFTNSRISPKQVLLPQTETLFKFKYDKEKVNLEPSTLNDNQRILFGIKACDVVAFTKLDKVFKDGELKDEYYIKRRENTIIISLACDESQESCFCPSVSIEPTTPPVGSDIFLMVIDNEYYVSIQTDKGKKLIKDNLFEDLKEEARGKIKETKLKINKKLSIINLEDIDKRLDPLFDNELFDKISRRCIGCGICSFSCPTCYCFDIQDDDRIIEGDRYRIWDSCQFKDFTLQASGHNPRPTKKERIRNRIFHKFNYFVEQYNEVGCVGCGRCINLCPVNIDIREVIELIFAAF